MSEARPVKKMLPLLLSFLLFLGTLPASAGQEDSQMDALILNLQSSLKSGSIEAYLDLFSDNLKEAERVTIAELSKEFILENTSFFRAHSQKPDDSGVQLYLQVLFQNPYAVLLETWRLNLQEVGGCCLITGKALVGANRSLYKIQIPAQESERADTVEIHHVDLRIRLTNALIFYDNIPGLNTALLVLGKGQVRFSPSSPREKHQMEFLYGKDMLEDDLEYVYIRSSQVFFDNNIKIERGEAGRLPATIEERNKAGALFDKLYVRSFTIENSLTGGLLSFLPKGEEAVIEFKGKKRGELAYIYSPFAEEEISLFQWKENRVLTLYTPVLPKEGKKLFLSFEKLFDIEDYKIDIHFNPKDAYVSGKAQILVKSNVPSLDGIKLKINSDFEILRINGEDGHELFYSRDRLRKFLYIYFHDPPAKNGFRLVEIYYRGKIAAEMLLEDVVSRFGYQDSDMLSQPKYKTYLYTRSSLWYPSPSDEDYFRARLKIIVPPGFFCIASGLLVGSSMIESLDDLKDVERLGSTVFVYQTKNPVKYLAFIVGDFNKIKELQSSPSLQYFRSFGVRTPGWDMFDEMQRIFDFYQKKFGAYPFEKLGIVQRYWSQEGGHSPPSFIVLNELPRTAERPRFLAKKSPVDLSRWKEYFLAHEIAHQWWGQGLSWTSYQDQWLSEGLAQFAAILYLREKYGQRTYNQILKILSDWAEKKSEWGPITLGSRISYLDFEAYQAIVYDKSALVMNMLMDLLGEEVFFKGLQEFFHRFKYTAARTHDFFRTLQDVSGRDLRLFLQGWFNSYRLPEIKVKEHVQQKDGGYLLNLQIVQLGDAFEFPLWVEWQENGKTVRKMIPISDVVSSFDINTTGKPTRIEVNADKAIPGKFH